ncbi:hypothetical protein ABID42_000389 [Arcicella rosea]|uniref:hypothetical protein n=1 Tax=Arcicella rosea TaxID=502909 RepID=UPI00345CE805
MKTTKKTTQNSYIKYNSQLDFAQGGKLVDKKIVKAKEILSKTTLPKELIEPFSKEQT